MSSAESSSAIKTAAPRGSESLASIENQASLLEILTDNLPVLIAYIDHDLRYRYSNKKHRQWWGLGKKNIVGLHVGEVLGEANLKIVEPHIRAALAGKSTQFEHLGSYPTTGDRYVYVNYVPDFSPDGKIRGTVVLVHDITEQRTAESRYRRLLETTKVIPWEADLEKKSFTYVGPQIRNLLGFSLEEKATPDFLVDRLHPEDRENILRNCFERTKSDSDFEFECRLVARNKQSLWFQTMVNVLNVDGKHRIIQGFFIDITATKESETKRIELDQKSQESQKMEALGTLACGVAHDFNNLLSGIRGYSDLCLAALKDDHQCHGYLKHVQRSTQRAKDLVQQILTFGTRTKIEKKSVLICNLVEEVIDLSRGSIPPSVSIKLNWPDTNIQLLVDASQIHQVLLNLVTNAAYAMRAKGGELEIRVEKRLVDSTTARKISGMHAGTYVLIQVKDNGEGMDEQTQKRIFEPYFTTKPTGVGSGLGLSVAHGIIASHGGAITVQSVLGRGSCFSIYLPLDSEIVQSEVKEESQPEPGTGRVLYIDDEEVLAQLGNDLLSMLGYSVVACTSSSEALNIFRNSPSEFDVVVTDQTMPDLSGDRLVQELLKIRPDIPVILCTGFSTQVDAEKAIKIGAKAFLNKPFSLPELAAAVHQVLRSS